MVTLPGSDWENTTREIFYASQSQHNSGFGCFHSRLHRRGGFVRDSGGAGGTRENPSGREVIFSCGGRGRGGGDIFLVTSYDISQCRTRADCYLYSKSHLWSEQQIPVEINFVKVEDRERARNVNSILSDDCQLCLCCLSPYLLRTNILLPNITLPDCQPFSFLIINQVPAPLLLVW